MTLSGEVEFDLAVIGAGVSGWTAARRGQDLGLKVVVLEKFDEAPGFGNGRLSGGVFHAAYLDVLRPADELYRTITWATSEAARPDVARAWADNSARSFDFLTAEGAVFGQRGHFEWNLRTMLPFPQLGSSPSESWRGAGPDLLLTQMYQRFVSGGGEFRPGARALELITAGESVVGVGTSAGDVHARFVLVADGGYHSNKEMAKRYFGSDEYVMRASHQNTGDGLTMALAVGASTVSLDQFYGHLQHRAALDDDRYWIRPSLDLIAEGGLVVTASGKRIGAGGSFMHIAHDIMRSESPVGSWVVLDDIGWKTLAATDGVGSPSVVLPQAGLQLETADTITGLSAATGTDETSLLRSIEAHNAVAGRPVYEPNSGEGMAHPPPLRVGINQGPFYAVPVVVGITFGLGGILVDGTASVLRDGKPIPGLLAAGNTMGGLQGGPNYGYAGGWSQASVFGLLAAETVAASRG